MEQKVLYGEQTSLTVQNMSFSGVTLSQFPEYLQAAAQVKKACALANGRCGGLSKDKAQRIAGACDRLIEGSYTDQFPVDVFHGGGGIGINMNLNEVIASLAGPDIHPVDDVNLSQSTSDVCHSALRITLRRLNGEALETIRGLEEEAGRRAVEYRGFRTIARTCWQDGMSVSCGALFDGLEKALRRQRARLEAVQEELLCVNLGGTVIGSGTGANPSYRACILEELQKVTGWKVRYRESLYDAAQYPDDLAFCSGEIRILSQILGKFARDLRLLSSGPETGLGELKLPPVQAGSSFFPGKVNPVIPEMVIQCSMLIAGNDSVIQGALGEGEVHINLWEEMMGFLLIQNIKMLTKSSALFLERCVRGIEPVFSVCEAYAASSIPLIVSYKEEYGYKALAERIKKEGLEAVVEQLKKEEKEKRHEK